MFRPSRTGYRRSGSSNSGLFGIAADAAAAKKARLAAGSKWLGCALFDGGGEASDTSVSLEEEGDIRIRPARKTWACWGCSDPDETGSGDWLGETGSGDWGGEGRVAAGLRCGE